MYQGQFAEQPEGTFDILPDGTIPKAPGAPLARRSAGARAPKRAALLELLEHLHAPELADVWHEDETIGWVYQFFNSTEGRREIRAESQAPHNSWELATRDQFFTPRYVMEFEHAGAAVVRVAGRAGAAAGVLPLLRA